MSLQTSLTSRRKFLERSLWGFGSAFIMPSLLQSCMTDHNIPPLTDPPALFDPQIDWNDDARTLVTSAIEMIPEAGDILGGLLDIFWPESKPDLWGQIRAQVEALVDQKIEENVYEQTYDNLQGLNNLGQDYLSYLSTGDLGSVKTQWILMRGVFAEYEPHFQTASYQLPLLPLFAQFANMYLAHLRDGWLHGKDWGLNDAEVTAIKTQLDKKITAYAAYALNTYQNQRSTVYSAAPKDDLYCEPFRTVNAWDRQMTLTVLDFMELWSFFTYVSNPLNPQNNIPVVSPREVYSDPYGNARYSGGGAIFGNLKSYPKAHPTHLTVFYNNLHIQGVQVTYPGNSGPDGQNQVTQGYTAENNSSRADYDFSYGTFDSNYFFGAQAYTVQTSDQFKRFITSGIQFMYNSGAATDMLSWGGTPQGFIGYAGKALSRVHVNGKDPDSTSADCIVFGFMDLPSSSGLTTVKLNSIKSLYIKAPKERTADHFAQIYPNLPANLINDDLKAARKKYWESFNK